MARDVLKQNPAALKMTRSSNLSFSEQDHLNSNEQRLKTAAAITRQDRANFHRFGLRDPAALPRVVFGKVPAHASIIEAHSGVSDVILFE